MVKDTIVQRITPAHAGKTTVAVQQVRHHTDHPRACGENSAYGKVHFLRFGSPPRMRGKPFPLPVPSFASRITPAHAGKTFSLPGSRALPPDHPRACGENHFSSSSTSKNAGSPPRMRGKPATTLSQPRYPRITPAHAGKTRDIIQVRYERPDHPRACGENPPFSFFTPFSLGSPPRMRGKRNFNSGRGSRKRITPAHAGKTAQHAALFIGSADHPRACGENRRWYDWSPWWGGSPPRMRGKRWDLICHCPNKRITPAHAGKTRILGSHTRRISDHPRACGENAKPKGRHQEYIGSPPRMRGKPRSRPAAEAAVRITPAHAGKTLRKWRISVVDPSPQPQSSLTSRKADASSGSQRAPCAAPV